MNISVPQYLSRTSYRQTAYSSTHGDTYNDRFENRWTCDTNKGLWLDQYGNSTGYHPDNIGAEGNPLASMDSHTWKHDGRSWVSNNGDQQAHYPGSPDPKNKSFGKKEPRNPPFTCQDDKFLRIAMRRLERQSNRPGFGNARAVRTFFDTVRERQAKRISKENKKGRKVDYFLFTKDDILGIALDESQLKKSDAYIKLQEMEGLKPVKEQINLLIHLGSSNLKREESERPLLEVMLNRVFLGNPGTGTLIFSNLVICYSKPYCTIIRKYIPYSIYLPCTLNFESTLLYVNVFITQKYSQAKQRLPKFMASCLQRWVYYRKVK
jgi:hypothetical protein